jgi:sulfur carrier protein
MIFNKYYFFSVFEYPSIEPKDSPDTDVNTSFSGTYMQITVNGEERNIAEGMTAAQLVKDMDIVGKRIAMEVNLEIVPRSQYDSFTFNEGDKVEVVHAVGGG